MPELVIVRFFPGLSVWVVDFFKLNAKLDILEKELIILNVSCTDTQSLCTYINTLSK